jgi:hypothetical protein
MFDFQIPIWMLISLISLLALPAVIMAIRGFAETKE